jgi:hypothetical protein
MIDRYLLILLIVLLVGTAGAFFLLMPILPTLVVSLMLIGLLAMFWLGLHVAKPPAETADKTSDPDQPDLVKLDAR